MILSSLLKLCVYNFTFYSRIRRGYKSLLFDDTTFFRHSTTFTYESRGGVVSPSVHSIQESWARDATVTNFTSIFSIAFSAEKYSLLVEKYSPRDKASQISLVEIHITKTKLVSSGKLYTIRVVWLSTSGYHFAEQIAILIASPNRAKKETSHATKSQIQSLLSRGDRFLLVNGAYS